jgi:hypothetical protein
MAKQKIVVGQLDNESMQDFIKFRIFVGLGSTRSLDKAYKTYYETSNELSPLWNTLADKNQWEARAAEFDKGAVTKPAK